MQDKSSYKDDFGDSDNEAEPDAYLARVKQEAEDRDSDGEDSDESTDEDFNPDIENVEDVADEFDSNVDTTSESEDGDSDDSAKKKRKEKKEKKKSRKERKDRGERKESTVSGMDWNWTLCYRGPFCINYTRPFDCNESIFRNRKRRRTEMIIGRNVPPPHLWYG